MERENVLRWLREHPEAVHGNAEEILTRCEPVVRRHAREDAWIAAKRYVLERRVEWAEHQGAHASEEYVAREVCGKLAYELQHHEPEVQPGDEDHLAGGVLKAAMEPEGWEHLRGPGSVEVAREQEHETWGEIVRYTRKRARDLIREHHLSTESDFDHTRCYGEIAPRIADLLARDFSRHAFPR